MTALYDASALYSGMIRDLLMRLALTDLVQARWSNAIHEEWTRALERNRPDLPSVNHKRVRQLMDTALPDALVTGFENLISSLDLPDKDDQHVLAAAIHAKADIIVTFNLKDFPTDALGPYDLKAIHPDTFACNLLKRAPEKVLAVVEEQRQGLANPAKTMSQMLLDFANRDLAAFADALKPFSSKEVMIFA